MPQKNSGPDALAGATGAGESIAERQSVPDSTTRRTAPELRRVQRQRAVERVHQLGPRVMAELLNELARYHPEIAAALDRRLERYAERLTPELMRAINGDRFPALPLRAIGGGR
jgi:hypothetical protein